MDQAKNRSAHNAVTHGVFASIVLDGHTFDREATRYGELLTVLRRAIKPKNGLEDTLVQKLAFLLLRLCRVYRADASIAPKMFARVSAFLRGDNSTAEAVDVEKESEVVVIKKEPTPDLVIRYEANVERQIARTFDQLSRMRGMKSANVKLIQTPQALKGGAQ